MSNNQKQSRQAMSQRQRLINNSGLYLLLIGGALIVLLPYIWMIITSLKTEEDMFQARHHE